MVTALNDAGAHSYVGRCPLVMRGLEYVGARRDRTWAIFQAIDIIDGCGALDACEAQARALVEDAWRAVEPLLPDSQFKIRLRAFGWFVLDRHY